MTHVLLVDDEPLLCDELADGLELEGFEVHAEHTVPDALNALATSPYDAVITDLKMPKLGGMDLIRALGQRSFDGVIIVISGHGAERSRTDALAAGARACLSKPVDVDEVVTLLSQHLPPSN